MKKILLIVILFAVFGLNARAQTPDWAWANHAGGLGDDVANAIATDAAGNVYMAGYFASSTILFGTHTLVNAGGYDACLVKYNSSGTVLWAKSFGGIYDEWVSAITVDAAGAIYITGYFDSPNITIGNTTLTDTGSTVTGDIFIAKYDSLGQVIWAKRAGGTDADFATAIASDTAGNIYLAGYFLSSNIAFDTTHLVNNGAYDIFLARYDTSGHVIWAQSTGGTLGDYASSLAIGASGNIYLAGEYGSSSITFGFSTLHNSSTGTNDIFIVKFAPNGQVLWANSAVGTTHDYANAVCTDNGGGVYLSGAFFSPTLTFHTTTLVNVSAPTYPDIFLVKYDSTGTLLWAKAMGGTDDDQALAMTVDTATFVYLTGFYESPSITFGTTTLNNFNGGSEDIFLAKYDSSGQNLWAKSVGGNNDDAAKCLATDNHGSLYVAGSYTSDQISFGNNILTNPANTTNDIFIAKIGTSVGIMVNPLTIERILVYPNPSSQFITIHEDYSIIRYQTNELVIIDILGRIVLQQFLTTHETEILVSGWSRGVYFYEIRNEAGISFGKLIIN